MKAPASPRIRSGAISFKIPPASSRNRGKPALLPVCNNKQTPQQTVRLDTAANAELQTKTSHSAKRELPAAGQSSDEAKASALVEMDTALGEAFFSISIYKTAAEEGLMAAGVKAIRKQQWKQRWIEMNAIAAEKRPAVDELSTADLNLLKRGMELRLAAAVKAAGPARNDATNAEINGYRATAECRISTALARIETYRTTTVTPWLDVEKKGRAPELKKLKTLALRESKQSVPLKGKTTLSSMVNATMSGTPSQSPPLPPLPPTPPPQSTVMTPPLTPVIPPLQVFRPQPQPRPDFPTPAQISGGEEEGVGVISSELDTDMALFPALPQSAGVEEAEITSTEPDEPMDETQPVDTLLGDIKAPDGTNSEFSRNSSPSRVTEDLDAIRQRVRNRVERRRTKRGLMDEDIELVRQRVLGTVKRRRLEKSAQGSGKY
jgi:hypothetical protein